MIIDKKNTPWVIGSAAVLLIATAVYLPYSRQLNGPSGGSFWGLAYGILGLAMMLIVMALALRKKFRTLRIGKTYHWTQAHIWLGLVSYPIILFHAGFHWGGSFTQIIMWLFTLVVITGIFGLAMQNIIPSKMLHDVPMETVYDQIDKIISMIRSDADERMKSLGQIGSSSEAYEMEYIAAGSATALAAVATVTKAPGAQMLQEFYTAHVRPFLYDQATVESKLSTPARAELIFDQMKRLLPPNLHDVLSDLQMAVEERRQLSSQRMLHHWLHWWLVVHVPLSYALIILAAIHAIFALRYA